MNETTRTAEFRWDGRRARYARRRTIAFGPFLAFGAIATILTLAS